MLRGVDVSSYQGSIDWHAVARSGCSFAFARASTGTARVDRCYTDNMRGMRAAGLVCGAYHYAHPGMGSSTQQADHFCDTVAGALPDMLALDLEEGSGDLSSWALEFLARCRQRHDRTTLLYTGLAFGKSHLRDGRLAGHHLWVAAYRAAQPPAWPPWSGWSFWQHTSSASIPGIAGRVDEDYFAGGFKEMKTLCGAELAEGGSKLNAPIVGMASSADGRGYYQVGADGGVFCFGSASFHGSVPSANIRLNAPIVGMAVHPDDGYVLFGADGGVFCFGTVPFKGGLGGKNLVKPIVGGGLTPDGQGYWMTGADGGVFAFGEATFLGHAGT
jgi:GH25 family lysozyme M1 (1,4-beta-N-acetylmuramidase)